VDDNRLGVMQGTLDLDLVSDPAAALKVGRDCHNRSHVYCTAICQRSKAADCALENSSWRSRCEQVPAWVANEAYPLMATGKSGKVAVVFDEELK